jgi:hypothetical protein
MHTEARGEAQGDSEGIHVIICHGFYNSESISKATVSGESEDRDNH